MYTLFLYFYIIFLILILYIYSSSFFPSLMEQIKPIPLYLGLKSMKYEIKAYLNLYKKMVLSK